ncbi:MAG: ParB N-terminal domain-containing protein [Planctomycetes bacterium]|nr:ParB N-terminal domain-containing protein [Planctomycetota bacterium]
MKTAPSVQTDQPKRRIPAKPIEETQNLNDLVDHPLQQAFFDALSEEDLRALADDIRRNGLRNKIQVLPRNASAIPPNTIIDGHQRRNALLMNGEKTAKVIVRYDLTDAKPAEIERIFLEANQNRRHLDPLAQARVALRQIELEKNRPRQLFRARDHDETRDRVGRILGMSGRNLDRYLRVLRAPVEVQNALRAKEIRLIDAGKVADLAEPTKAVIVKRLRAGEAAKIVIGEYLAGDRNETHSAKSALKYLTRQLAKAVLDLGDRVGSIAISSLRMHLADLSAGKVLLDKLIRRAATANPSDDAGGGLKKLLEGVAGHRVRRKADLNDGI